MGTCFVNWSDGQTEVGKGRLLLRGWFACFKLSNASRCLGLADTPLFLLLSPQPNETA